MKANYKPQLSRDTALEILATCLDDAKVREDIRKEYLEVCAANVENLTDAAQTEFVRQTMILMKDHKDETVSAMATALLDDPDAARLFKEKVLIPVAEDIKAAAENEDLSDVINNPNGYDVADIENEPAVASRQKRGIFKGIGATIRKYSASIFAFFKKIGSAIKRGIMAAGAWVKKAAKGCCNKTSSFFRGISNWFKQQGAKVSDAMDQFKDWLRRVGAWFKKHPVITAITVGALETLFFYAGGFTLGKLINVILSRVVASGATAFILGVTKAAVVVAGCGIVSLVAAGADKLNTKFFSWLYDFEDTDVEESEIEVDYEESAQTETV